MQAKRTRSENVAFLMSFYLTPLTWVPNRFSLKMDGILFSVGLVYVKNMFSEPHLRAGLK